MGDFDRITTAFHPAPRLAEALRELAHEAVHVVVEDTRIRPRRLPLGGPSES